MQYTAILNLQRAISAAHRRDKAGALHVSHAELAELVSAANIVIAEIEADGNQTVRSARTASEKIFGSPVTPSDSAFEFDDEDDAATLDDEDEVEDAY